MKEEQVVGRNPVKELLKNGRPIEKLMIAKGAEKTLGQIIAMAKESEIPLYFSDRERLDQICEDKNHQGIIAFVSGYEYAEMEQLFQKADEKGETPFFVILDGIEDPHNLGAILRSADGSGVHGIIIPKRRAVGVTSVVAKVSAGAIEYVPICRVSNLTQTINELKKQGFWIAGVDMGQDKYYQCNLTGKICLVIGNEGNGISKLVKENCDFIVSIPMYGGVSSLNASNAAAITFYEVRRQRELDKG